MNREQGPPSPNLVLVESGGSKSFELGRYPDIDSARAAAREAAGDEIDFAADPDYGGWLARAGDRVLRILEPGAASRFLEMADTPASGGTTDLEMDQNPANPDEG